MEASGVAVGSSVARLSATWANAVRPAKPVCGPDAFQKATGAPVSSQLPECALRVPFWSRSAPFPPEQATAWGQAGGADAACPRRGRGVRNARGLPALRFCRAGSCSRRPHNTPVSAPGHSRRRSAAVTAPGFHLCEPQQAFSLLNRVRREAAACAAWGISRAARQAVANVSVSRGAALPVADHSTTLSRPVPHPGPFCSSTSSSNHSGNSI